MLIKLATVEDAEAILAIYAPYVRNTAITFEYDVPDNSRCTACVRNDLNTAGILILLLMKINRPMFNISM